MTTTRSADKPWIGALVSASARRPKRTIALWVVGVVAAGALASSLMGGALTSDGGFVNNPEAKRAEQLLEDRLRGERRPTEVVVVRASGLTVDHPAMRVHRRRTRSSRRGSRSIRDR